MPAGILFTFALIGLAALRVDLVQRAQAAEQAAPKKIATVEGITEYHLDNGLKILLVPDPSKPTVTVNLTVFVGSRHEGYGEAGMAHLLEHMLFKGSPTHPTVPKLLQALDLLRQVLREPSLPKEELEILKREQSATLEKQLNDPTALAFRAVRRALNPYDKDDPRHIATVAEQIDRFKAVSRDEVKKLYDEFLGAQGELVITGDFDVDQTVAALSKILADWKSPQPFAELHRSGDVKLSSKIETISTPEKANATYAAGTVFPLRDDDPEYALLLMADFVLGGGTLSSRLGDRVRQKEGLSYGVRSSLTASPVDKRTAFSIFAICNPSNMEKLKQAIDEEVARLLKDGVTPDELELAKRGYLQGQEVARTDGSLAKILSENLRAGRTMKYYADLEKKISAATPTQVDEAFRKYVDPKRMVIVEAGDFTGKTAEAKTPKTGSAPE